ncbi:hypothetical protein [Halobacillus sp. A5]|uniref:hypothetical protein n=1 Tax=Halobacillus sp. A5 TaxID=2880263 RepID=UPI0020A6307C|nr:hypothetical protein [Halobacillus sp. A5]MCP3027093.1 hypothetical protein [Halobacillus sp. A5]
MSRIKSKQDLTMITLLILLCVLTLSRAPELYLKIVIAAIMIFGIIKGTMEIKKKNHLMGGVMYVTTLILLFVVFL